MQPFVHSWQPKVDYLLLCGLSFLCTHPLRAETVPVYYLVNPCNVFFSLSINHLERVPNNTENYIIINHFWEQQFREKYLSHSQFIRDRHSGSDFTHYVYHPPRTGMNGELERVSSWRSGIPQRMPGIPLLNLHHKQAETLTGTSSEGI